MKASLVSLILNVSLSSTAEWGLTANFGSLEETIDGFLIHQVKFGISWIHIRSRES